MSTNTALPGSAGALAGGGNWIKPDEIEALKGSAAKLAGGERPDPDARKMLPDGFVEVFGPMPVAPATFSQTIALMRWQMHLRDWGGIDEAATLALLSRELVYAEDGKQKTIPLPEFYELIGLGWPLVWTQKNRGKVVAFPNARYYQPTSVRLDNVVDRAGIVWREWHLDSVRAGFYVSDLNPNFPASIAARNEANKAGE